MLQGSWHQIDQKRFQTLLKARPDAKIGMTYTQVSANYGETEWVTGEDCPYIKTIHANGLNNLPDYYEWIFKDEDIQW